MGKRKPQPPPLVRHLKEHGHKYALVMSACLAEMFGESIGKAIATVLKVMVVSS